MLNSILEYQLFASGNFSFTVLQLLGSLLLLLGAFLAWRLTMARWRIDFFNRYQIDPPNRRRFERYLRSLVVLLTILLFIKLLDLDIPLYASDDDSDDAVVIRYSLFLIAILLLQLAWLVEWFLANIVLNRDSSLSTSAGDIKGREANRSKITKLIQYVVLVLAAIAIIRNLGLDFTIASPKISGTPKDLQPSNILVVILIFLIAQIAVWISSQMTFFGLAKRKDIGQGAIFAINQILKYLIYVIAAMIALNSLGIKMTLIWGGAAALLVGVGLGLQQTFNDFFSGLVLLFERSVAVGAVMEIDGEVGTVNKIGLRSSIIETRSSVSIIVPNSKLVNESVKNWTHFVSYGRFEVSVGVAYGSDTQLVKKLLLQAVQDHPKILEYPKPFVRFKNFGDSSLDFGVFFFSKDFIPIEDVRSDIRLVIDKLFRENDITIPFPQRDVWLRQQGGTPAE